jgi:hypothetical protein
MRLAPNAKLVSTAPMTVTEPTPQQTALELPTRLVLSPLVTRGWVHTRGLAAPQGNNQRVELWHSRFTPANQGALDTRRLRALWSRSPATQDDLSDSSAGLQWSMNDQQRRKIAEQSLQTLDAPIRFRNLMLTSLGGYLDARASWAPGSLPGQLVTKWEHRTTLGRDQFVEVTVIGHLFPFGHRVLYTEISERKADLQKGFASLEKRAFLTILDDEYDYEAKVSDTKAKRSLPFRKIRILTRVTPFLDVPAPNNVFVPRVDGIPFRFEMEGEDQSGRLIRLSFAAVYTSSLTGNAPQIARALYMNQGVPSTHQGQGLPLLFRMGYPLGQRIAFAPSTRDSTPSSPVDDPKARFDDGSFPVFMLMLKDTVLTGATPFMPAVDVATIDVEAIQAVSGKSGYAMVRPHALFVNHGLNPASNPCETLLEIVNDPQLPYPKLDFGGQSAKSGGFISPSMEVRALSRSLGAIAASSPSSLAAFSPSALFGAFNDAKLFGVFSLLDIIETAQQLAELPRLIGQSLDRVRGLLADLYRLRELLAKLQASAAAVTKAINALEDAASLGDLVDLHGVLSTLVPPGMTLFTERKEAEGLVARLKEALGGLVNNPGELARLLELAQRVKSGDLLESGAVARYVYQPRLKAYFLPGQPSTPLFQPGTLTVVAEARTRAPGRPAGAEVAASLEDFRINLIPGFEAMTLRFKRLAFRVAAGKKPELDVEFDGIDFKGPLAFIERLKAFIPLDGFSDPPNLDVSPEGITAGFSLALPTVAVGMFSLSNVALSAAFRVPFLGADPLSVRFGFASREQPFNLTVSFLGGGGFFGIEVSPRGLSTLEAALEFGASVSLNFGVASGSVSVMAGIYFALGDQEEARLEGYLRVRGAVSVLGLINASIELYMALGWVSGKVYGRAELSVCIEILFFSKTVTISYERRFSGTNDDPTFAEIMAPYLPTDRALPQGGKAPEGEWPWKEYVEAFAPEGA